MNITIPQHVEVTNNGIIFYSNRMPIVGGIHAYIEGNDVKVKETFYSSTRSHNHTLLKMCTAIAFLFFGFLLQKRSSLNIIAMSICFLLHSYKNLFVLCEEFFYSHISKKKRRRQRIKCAKTMLFNSCKKLNGIPNLWEINNIFNDDLHKKMLQTLGGILLSIIFMFYTYKNIFQLFGFYVVASIITTIAMDLLNKTKIFTLLQWIFLTEPTDLELQCVLDGFYRWTQLEAEIEN